MRIRAELLLIPLVAVALYFVAGTFFAVGFCLLYWLASWLARRLPIFPSVLLSKLFHLAGLVLLLTVAFWVAFGYLVGKGLEEDARERQRTTGESLFGG